MGVRRRPKQKPAVAAEPVEIADAEYEVVIERAAAIDVAKATGTVCVRLPGKSGRRFSRVWEAPARTGAINELAAQLIDLEVEKVTLGGHLGLLADLVLPAGGGGAGCAAGQRPRCQERARAAQNGQARLSLASQINRKGLLRPSFVPPAPVRRLRDYTRLRTDLTRERARYWQRLEKLLER